MSEQVEVKFTDKDNLIATDDKLGEFVLIPKRFQAALLRALVEQAGGVEVEVWRTDTAGSAFANLPRSVNPGKYVLLPLEAPE